MCDTISQVKFEYRITPDNSPGELFFRGGQKGGSVIRGGGVIRWMGSYYFELVIQPKSLLFLLKLAFHDVEIGIDIWLQHITALEPVEITLSALWRPTTCLEWFRTTLSTTMVSNNFPCGVNRGLGSYFFEVLKKEGSYSR